MIITLMLPAVFATSAQGVPHAGEYGSLVQDNNKTDMESISIGSAWADSSRVYDLDEVVVVSQTKEHLERTFAVKTAAAQFIRVVRQRA